MTQILIDQVQQLGLSTYEAKAYLALLERETLTVPEVSKLSGVPRARTYDVLDKLVDNGLAVMRPGKFRKYAAVDFDTFKERLILQNEEQYSKQKAHIDKVALTLKKKFGSLVDAANFKDDPLDYIEVFRNPNQLHSKIMQLCGDAEREILMFVKPPYAGSRKNIEEQLNQRAELVKKGISIRCVYEIPEDEEALRLRLQTMKLVTEWGEQAKLIKELPMKMGIFDEKTVVIALEDSISQKTSITTLVIEHRSLAKSLKILFNLFMEQAEDLRSFVNKGDMKKERSASKHLRR